MKSSESGKRSVGMFIVYMRYNCQAEQHSYSVISGSPSPTRQNRQMATPLFFYAPSNVITTRIVESQMPKKLFMVHKNFKQWSSKLILVGALLTMLCSCNNQAKQQEIERGDVYDLDM